jgi:hypothetical protein
LADFIDALHMLNHEINGPKPSATIGDDAKVVQTAVAYSVAEVARMLRDDGLDEAAWMVDTGWLAILAGDIDDIRSYIAGEQAAQTD